MTPTTSGSMNACSGAGGGPGGHASTHPEVVQGCGFLGSPGSPWVISFYTAGIPVGCPWTPRAAVVSKFRAPESQIYTPSPLVPLDIPQWTPHGPPRDPLGISQPRSQGFATGGLFRGPHGRPRVVGDVQDRGRQVQWRAAALNTLTLGLQA